MNQHQKTQPWATKPQRLNIESDRRKAQEGNFLKSLFRYQLRAPWWNSTTVFTYIKLGAGWGGGWRGLPSHTPCLQAMPPQMYWITWSNHPVIISRTKLFYSLLKGHAHFDSIENYILSILFPYNILHFYYSIWFKYIYKIYAIFEVGLSSRISRSKLGPFRCIVVRDSVFQGSVGELVNLTDICTYVHFYRI